MKKIICLILMALVFLSVLPLAVSAENSSAQEAAEKLHMLGLLAGVGKNADGSVNFDIDSSLNRAQAATLIVRFLGAEDIALSEPNNNPFKDIPEWAEPYVSYAYSNKAVNGVSATKFAPEMPITDAAFMTILLRVMGYNDVKGDFAWDKPYNLAKKIGLIDSETPDDSFTRGDAFSICYKALTADTKTDDSLKDRLLLKNVFTAEQFAVADAYKLQNTDNPMPDNPSTDDVIDTPKTSTLLTIDDLNTNNVQWSHVNDDINTVYLENNYRENVVLNSREVASYRYDDAVYPRFYKIKEDLYFLTWIPGDSGGGLYWTTSPDDKVWEEPQLLYNNENMQFTQSEGPRAGQWDQLVAHNPDLCVLDNGELILSYYIRPGSSYGLADYFEQNGVYIVRGTVSEDNKITWGKEMQVSYGHGWEPYIWQRDNGRIEIYWTNYGPYRSIFSVPEFANSGMVGNVSMIYSDDNGYTWTPSLEEGAKNHYLYDNIFQQKLASAVKITGAEGTYPLFGAQMPVVTQLYDGRLLLAVEVPYVVKGLDLQDMHLTLATSMENGEWKRLGIFEEAMESTFAMKNFSMGTGPYVVTFPSGEVYLTHGDFFNTTPKGRLISPDASTLAERKFKVFPTCTSGFNACSEIVDSHKVISVVTGYGLGERRSVFLNPYYLNHRTNSIKAAITVDGNIEDWSTNTDALFVGSESQAQITQQIAHDDENIYFLINRLDEFIDERDSVTVNVASGENKYYSITVTACGTASILLKEEAEAKVLDWQGEVAVKTVGTVNNDLDSDEGVIFEISVPKSALGISDAEMVKVCPELENYDGLDYIKDTLVEVSFDSTVHWPNVVLEN